MVAIFRSIIGRRPHRLWSMRTIRRLALMTLPPRPLSRHDVYVIIAIQPDLLGGFPRREPAPARPAGFSFARRSRCWSGARVQPGRPPCVSAGPAISAAFAAGLAALPLSIAKAQDHASAAADGAEHCRSAEPRRAGSPSVGQRIVRTIGPRVPREDGTIAGDGEG